MTLSTENELTAMTKNSIATAFTYDAWGRRDKEEGGRMKDETLQDVKART